jgi:hypothetical protein
LTIPNLSACPQEFALLDPLSQTSADFAFNFDVTETSPWKLVKVRAVPAACLDARLVGHASVASMYEVCSKEWILPAAIDQGIWLSDKQIKQILGSINADMPRKGTGSGKNGAVTKYDRALHLVRFLFPDASGSDITRMVSSLMGRAKPKVDLSLLSHVAELDPENADSFRKDVQDAVREFTEQAFREGKESQDQYQAQKKEEAQAQEAREAVKSSEKALHDEVASKATSAWNCTPDTLKKLLPGEGSIKVFGIYYAASQKHFRAVYPIGSLAVY